MNDNRNKWSGTLSSQWSENRVQSMYGTNEFPVKTRRRRLLSRKLETYYVN